MTHPTPLLRRRFSRRRGGSWRRATLPVDPARSNRSAAIITGAAGVAAIGVGALLAFWPLHSSGRIAVGAGSAGRFGLEVHPRVGGEEVRLRVTF